MRSAHAVYRNGRFIIKLCPALLNIACGELVEDGQEMRIICILHSVGKDESKRPLGKPRRGWEIILKLI